MKKGLVLIMLVGFSLYALGQSPTSRSNTWDGKFEQLGTDLPTPNTYRTASGAPGTEYWQQKADYDIKVELSEKDQTITGSETITYFNNSPDNLSYLWGTA